MEAIFALVAQFDPVALTLPEIEAMQAMLVDLPERKRAEEDGPAEQATDVPSSRIGTRTH